MARKKKSNTKASTKMKAPGVKKSVDNMKYEIASEFGVHLGANATSRDNGIVGGEMTKRLVANGKNSKKSKNSK